MMNKRIIAVLKSALCFLLLIFAAAACEPELAGLVRYEEESAQEETKAFVLDLAREDWPVTRSNLGDGVEDIFSGAVLAVYAGGVLDSEVRLAPGDLGKKVELRLPAGRKYNFYILGNLWELSSGGDTRTIQFPIYETDVRTMSYRLDGGAVADGFRREKFSELAKYGIPLYWEQKGVDASSGGADVRMRRLFAKLTVEIDHSGLVGDALDDFVNGSLRIRQTNCLLKPFDPAGSKAESSEDILDVGDYDSDMDNSLCGEYVYYVPENRQGVLLPDNADPDSKDMESVEAAHPGRGIGGRLTYVEFDGNIGGDSGFSGRAVYRFFLGKDALGDFDIERNLDFRVRLGFRAESVFCADWKIEVEGLSDRREFFLSGELAGRLPDGQVAVVRKNRPAVLDLNLCLDDGQNRISSVTLADDGFRAAHIGDIAWTSDFWSATHDAANEPARARLAELGISVGFDSGRFTFEVSDPSRFVPGQEIPLCLTLFPGGRRLRAVIKTGEDIAVNLSGSILDDFYIAQHRTVSFSGFEGKTVYYAAEQDDCTIGSSSKSSYNRQWKASNSLSAPFPTCHTASDGSAVYPYQDYSAYSTQCLPVGDRLDVYTFFPNDFAMIYGYQSSRGYIVICSDDILNDGLSRMQIFISAPRLKLQGEKSVRLPVDGNECSIGGGIYSKAGGRAFGKDEFDPLLYGELLAPRLGFDADAGIWADCVGLDALSGKIWLSRTQTGSVKAADLTEAEASDIGMVTVSANPSTGLYSGSMDCRFGISLPRLASEPAKRQMCQYLDEDGFASRIEVPIAFVLDGGDASRYEFSSRSSGNVPTIAGETFSPVISGEYGYGRNGLAYYWCYDESLQPCKTSDGQFVPGGLILPYGEQTVTFSAVNKWDGSRVSVDASFSLVYRATMQQLGVFGDTPYATVYPLPKKSINYIMKHFAEAGEEASLWMIKLLGTDTWLYKYTSGPDFYNSIDGAYRQPNAGIYYSTGYYHVRYVDKTAYKWSAALARSAYNDSRYQWLNSLKIGGSSGWCSDPEKTGSEYLELFFTTTKGGYIYTGSREFLPKRS